MTGGDDNKRKSGAERAVGALRTAILNAARIRFAHENYDRVHLSEIAGDAQVDTALIEEYFGSKENLLSEVLADAIYPSVLMDGDRSAFGARLMSAFADGKPHELELDYFLLLLRIAMVPSLQPMLRKMIQNRLLMPFTAWIGGPDAPLRARLVHTLLTGASMQTVLSGDVPMAPEDKDRFRSFFARIMQELVDGNNPDDVAPPLGANPVGRRTNGNLTMYRDDVGSRSAGADLRQSENKSSRPAKARKAPDRSAPTT